MLLSVDLNGCIQVLNKGYFPKLFFRRFWLLRRNNVITTTDIKQLKPYMYQLISFKIILHLHLLVKLSMQVVFVSQKFKNYTWLEGLYPGYQRFFLACDEELHPAARKNLWCRQGQTRICELHLSSGQVRFQLYLSKAQVQLSLHVELNPRSNDAW